MTKTYDLGNAINSIKVVLQRKNALLAKEKAKVYSPTAVNTINRLNREISDLNQALKLLAYVMEE